MSSFAIDPESESLIAQLIAEDLAEPYQSHSAPIGASYHDYEEPLSSYERQCLDAEDHSDGEGEAPFGCGWEDSDGDDGDAPDQGLPSTEPAAEDTWDPNFANDEVLVQEYLGLMQTPSAAVGNWASNYLNEDSLVQDYPGPLHTPAAVWADGDDSDSDNSSSSDTSLPARIVSLPPYSVLRNSAGEIRNLSAPTTLPNQRTPGVRQGEVPVPCESPESSDHTSQGESLIPSTPPLSIEPVFASSIEEAEDPWNDGVDYSSYKNKGPVVRAYDEFKQGTRGGGWESWDHADWNDEEGLEEGEIVDDSLPFIRIPWPDVEADDCAARREDTEVVEIRVGDDETLESILRDISLREERRKKGKYVEGIGEEMRGRQDRVARKDVAAWW